MNQSLGFVPGVSIVLLALHHLHRLRVRLMRLLRRRALHRAQARAAVADIGPHAPPSLWTTLSTVARVHRHGQRD